MKIAGIIAEYNPFHNGHKYHMEETRRKTGADYIIVVMSGNFVQRGSPALMDKYSRARMALNNGADLVFELPVCYSVGSAEYFATGAVALLDQLGIVDVLCFGSECGDIILLEEAADLLLQAPKSFDEKLFALIKEGFTYPAARSKAMEQYLSESVYNDKHIRISEVLSEPNNILGLEYIKVIRKLGSDIKPITIQRQTAHYHDLNLGEAATADSQSAAISSATALRNAVFSINHLFELATIESSVPADVYEFMRGQYGVLYPITEENFSSILKYKLQTENKAALMSYMDISSDLADRMKNLRNLYSTIQDLSKSLKTKNLTYTRINRALIHILLNIRAASFQEYCNKGYIFYGRVLGLRKDSSQLLRQISDLDQLPIITKLSKDFREISPLGQRMLSEDIFATHLYNQEIYEAYGTCVPNEYQRSSIIV